MKKLLTLSVIGTSLMIGSTPAKADWDNLVITNFNGSDFKYHISTYDSNTGIETLLTTHCADYWDAPTNTDRCSGGMSDAHIDNSGNLTWSETMRSKDGESLPSKIYSYDIKTNTISEVGTPWKQNYHKNFSRPNIIADENGNTKIEVNGDQIIEKKASGTIQLGADGNDIDVVSDGLNIDGDAVITKNADGSIQIGADGNDIDITSEGLTVDGVSLITKKDSGEIHIGKNSLITKEEDGVQKLYAQDESGNAINIDVTNGSKLLIDGVEVSPTGTIPQVKTNKNNISTNKANIKNLGEGVAGSTALTAALSALPQTSKESKLSCGVGTGAYSSRYAVGFGCASKVNERVDINAGGSYVFGGSKSYGGGTLDSGVVKAGFVFKLGELNKSTQISMKEKKEFKKEISILKENNEKIISQNNALLARLERLEKVALGDLKSKDLAVYPLK